MDNRDKVVVLLAGGRIVRRRGGTADRAALSGDELRALLPEDIRELATFQDWSAQPISNYTLRMCGEFMEMVFAFIDREGARGVVVTCGIQGMAELAYFADLVWDLNPPLVFTGSLFDAGSPYGETPLLLEQSIRAALSDDCAGKGALICAQDAVYAPADVVQISNFRRSGIIAFPEAPLCIFAQPFGELIPMRPPRRRRPRRLSQPLARNIAIVTASLGEGDLMLKALLDKRVEELDGLVVVGMGDGDVPPAWPPLLRKIMRADVPIVLASRAPGGIVQAAETFEGSAAHLLDMGLIDAGELSPYQARIRLAVGLATGLSGEGLAGYVRGR